MLLQSLIPVLLDFERTPGRFSLSKREPALLFQQAHTVLLLAAGRPVDGLDAWDAGAQAQARQAARFFVRAGLLRPGTDPYTVLGLPRTADENAIRTHYRLMIRLTHPDFSGSDGEWPADAASRINLANDTLSSASRRADLDHALAKADTVASGARSRHPAAHASPVSAARGRSARTARPHPPHESLPPATRLAHRGFEVSARWKMTMLVGGAVAATAGLLALNPSGDHQSLVARDKSSQDQLALKPASTTTVRDLQQVLVESQPEPAAIDGAPANGLRLSENLGAPRTVLESEPASAVPSRVAAPNRAKVAKSATPLPATKTPGSEAVAAAALSTVAAAPAAVTAEPAQPAVQAQPVVALTEAASPSVAAASPATPPPVAPSGAPGLPEVRPMLVRIEQAAQQGLGVPLAMLIHPSARKNPGTQKFVFDFQDALAGYRVMGLTRTEVDSREVGDQLDVDLRMHFNLEDLQGSTLSRKVGVRARFGKLDDKVALVRMTVVSQGGRP